MWRVGSERGQKVMWRVGDERGKKVMWRVGGEEWRVWEVLGRMYVEAE